MRVTEKLGSEASVQKNVQAKQVSAPSKPSQKKWEVNPKLMRCQSEGPDESDFNTINPRIRNPRSPQVHSGPIRGSIQMLGECEVHQRIALGYSTVDPSLWSNSWNMARQVGLLL